MTGEIFSVESFMLSCLWQSTIFLAAGLSGSLLLRRHSARAHRVLLLAMIAAVIVPAASTLVKHYELGLFVAEPAVIQSPIENRAIYEATDIIPSEAIERSPAPINEYLHSVPAVSKAVKFPWRSALIYAWIAASLILAARLLVTFVLGARLLGRALPLNSDKIEQVIHQAKAKLRISRDVMIYSSANIRSPVIWCWRRKPVLLVPSAAGRFDNGIDWAGVLCHELAHYKRRDHVAGLLTELAVCILPWHPLLWWAKFRLVTLSEQACDDWVVASGRPGTDYAESLLNLTPGGQMAFVPAVVSSKKGLAGRVRRILKDSCGNPRTGAVWAVAVSITVVCMAVGIAFAQTRPVKSQVPGKREADELDQEQPDPRKLPVGWSLDYDDGLLANGGRHWPANMAKDLASLEILLKPYDPFKASLKGEKYEFWIFSLEGEQMGNIRVWPETEMPVPHSKIFKPGKYALKYRRRWGPSGDNFRMECGEYPIDLSKPGMYELTFTPKIGTAEITGTLGGCYAINFKKIGNAPWIRGFAYQDPRLGKQYTLDGLPPGKYRLSAVTMHESPNVFVSQAKVTVGAEDKAIVNIVPVPIENCSLKGNILGKQKKYKTPWPDQWPESDGKWYVLIRKRGSDAVGSMEAYEALTMDSLYVIRSGSIVQQTQDRAQYHIEGVAPGQYTVTAIEHPSWGGCTVTRQLSKNLTLKAGEDAVLDFDLQIIPEHNYDTGAKADSEEAASLIKVTGLVKDPQGRPVSGASVTLFQTKLEYVTDAEGKFVASLAPSDKMRYFFAVNKQRKLVASGRLAGGKQHVEIELMPARMMSGRVLDPNGRPVSGAQVAPLPMTCFHVLTDSEGRFDVGWSPKWHAPDHELCLMVRHTELNLAAVVDIAPEDRTIDVKLEHALALHGTIEDTNGRPILGAVVGLSLIRGWGAGTPVRDVITDYQGRFELLTLPQKQEYGIGANAEGYVPNAIKTGVINNITEREEVGPVILGGAPHQDEGKAGLGRLLINVVDEDGKAVGIDSVLIWNKTDDGGSRGYSFPAVATDKQGFYEIRNVPVGKHQAISVDREGFARLKKFDIEVREDGTEAITCVLSRGGIIEGFVTDEQNNPVVGVPVTINSTTGQGTKNLTTDENGHFIATHVADGRHSVYAHPPAGSPYEIQRVKGGVLCGTKDVHIVFKKREDAKNIRSAAGPGFEPKPAQTVNSARQRVISFPEGRSMGRLFARDAGADSWYEGWQELGEAKGDVSVAAGKEVKLQISEQAAGDLTALDKLEADDLQMLSFGWKAMKVGSLVPISNLKGLKTLNIQSARFDSEDFKFLTGLAQLEVLRCGDHKLTDTSMRYVGQLTSLRSLALWGTGISDEGLKHLQGLTNLTFLALNRCEITDQGLDYLRNMAALEGLQIYQTKITDNGLEKLRGLTRLKHINLDGNGITDAGLKHIKSLTSLENIWINSNPITDKGLSYLAGMKNLKQLYALDTKITDAGLANLKGKGIRLVVSPRVGPAAAFAQKRPNEPNDAVQDNETIEGIPVENEKSAAVGENQLVLRLIDSNGRSVAGAKVGTNVRAREAAFLGNRFSWRLPGKENNVSNERGEIELTRKNPFPDWWPPERKAALYVLHEERKIGTICEISKDDSRGEIPLILQPVCHVHGKLGSKAFERIGWPLSSGSISLSWRDHKLLSADSYGSGKEQFDFWVPADKYKLTGHGIASSPDHPPLSCLMLYRTVTIEVEQGLSEQDLGTVNAPASKLAELIGKPAPEFGPLQWMNGPATTLSELKGKVVLLYFGLADPIIRLRFSELIELHNQFADKGLTIIEIYNCKSMEELKGKWAKAHKDPGVAQDVPFRVALDGGESTFVGDFERLGAMHGMYDITEPVTILIEPTGTVAGILNVRQAAGVIRDMLGIGPIEWRKRFDEVYRLEDDQILKRIAPPFIPERREYFVNERSSRAWPAAMIFDWRDSQMNLSYTLDHPSFSLSNLVQYIFKIGNPDMWWGDTGNYSGNPDGPEQLLGMKLPGDWILRNEAPPEVKIQALEKLIADEFGRNITIRNSIEQRDVIVATGQFKISLVHSDEAIVMFADEDESVREKGENIVSGTNTIAQFLQQLGWLVSVPVIDRTEITEDTGIEYRANLGWPSLRRITDMSEKKDKLRFFLDTLSAQTNLQFEITREPIEVWFVTEDTEN